MDNMLNTKDKGKIGNRPRPKIEPLGVLTVVIISSLTLILTFNLVSSLPDDAGNRITLKNPSTCGMQNCTVTNNYYNVSSNNGDTSTVVRYNDSSTIYTKNDYKLTIYGNSSMLLGNPASGGIEINQTRPQSKAGIWWNAYDKATNINTAIAWMTAHYNSTENNGVHSHFGIETLDNSTGTPTLNSHFEITYNGSQNRASVTFPGSTVTIQDLDSISSITNNIRFFPGSGKTFVVYPNGQSSLGFSINSNTQNVTISATGTTNLVFGDNINDEGYNISANLFKGNGSLLTGVCKSDGTDCTTSGGSADFTNVAFVNKTNNFTQQSIFSGQSSPAGNIFETNVLFSNSVKFDSGFSMGVSEVFRGSHFIPAQSFGSNLMDLGNNSNRWRVGYFETVNASKNINSNGNFTGDWFKGKVNWSNVQNIPTLTNSTFNQSLTDDLYQKNGSIYNLTYNTAIEKDCDSGQFQRGNYINGSRKCYPEGYTPNQNVNYNANVQFNRLKLYSLQYVHMNTYDYVCVDDSSGELFSSSTPCDSIASGGYVPSRSLDASIDTNKVNGVVSWIKGLF